MMRVISLSFFLLMSTWSFAQTWTKLNGDELFALARKTAFDGDRQEARSMLRYTLKQYPSYDDVRIFLARTYYWDNKLDSANNELEIILKKDPLNIEALDVMTDVQLANSQPEKAYEFADKGLKQNPLSEDFLYKEAKALVQLDRPREAGVLLARLMSINPSHTKGLQLTNEIKSAGLKNAVGLQYGIDVFSRTYTPANYLSLQLMRTEKPGTGIIRLNYANRFSLNGLQGEIDLYPKISQGLYAYLNYGYSNSSLFPLHRTGAEIYSKFLKSFEGSLGLRYLYFNASNTVLMYTGSVSLYHGNYLFSFRPFVVPSSAGNALSSVANIRRYFRDGDNYMGVTGGFGFSPDERRIQTTNGLSSDAVFNLKSQRILINWQKTFPANYIALFSIGLVRQELSFSVGNYVWITTISAAVRKRY